MRLLASNLRRYLRLYFIFAKYSLVQTLVYRANSLIMAVTPIVWLLTTIVFVSIIFRGSKEIGGWNYWEVLFLLGIHELIFSLTWMTFNKNLHDFSFLIKQGTFDKNLLLPVNPRFLISFNSLDLTATGSLLNVLVMIFLSSRKLELNPSFIQIILFFSSLILSYITVYLVSFCIASLNLFFLNADIYLDWLLEMTDFDRYPAEIYGNFLRNFLFFVIPIMFFAYVPAGILLGKLPWYFVVFGAVINIWLYVISVFLWRRGLKNYQSASS